MTPFQERCIGRVSTWLATHQIPLIFEEVRGKTERYLRSEIAVGECHIEVFVYEDEAGVMTEGKAWRLCERWDFANDEQMIDRLLETIGSELRLR